MRIRFQEAFLYANPALKLFLTLNNKVIELNPNQRGMPASTKEGALEEKIQLAEGGAGFSRQKRWT